MKDQHFYRPDEALCGKVLHYKECGLDNIFLLNGFKVEEHDGEEYVSIADSDGLNDAIGMHIVLHRKAPSGKEVRFLRNQLDMSQAELADLMSVTDQSVARWEKETCEAPGPAILALRMIYILSKVEEEVRDKILDGLLQRIQCLVNSDETEDFAQFRFDSEGNTWVDTPEAA